MLRRKNYWLLFAILLLSLTSLSPSMDLNRLDGPPPLNKYQSQVQDYSSRQKGEPVHLRISVSLSDNELRELKKISGNYTLFSGVTIELNNLGEAAGEDALMKELTVGDRSDIVMTDAHHIRGLAQQGYLLPVDVYESSAGGTPLAPLLPLLQWNGYAWGVPLDIDPYVFVYSPQRMKELEAEALPRSLDQWNRLLEQIRKEPKKYVLAMDANNAYGLSAFMESAGSALFPASRKALDWIVQNRGSLFLTDGLDGGIWNMLREGNIAAAIVRLSEWEKNGGGALTAELPWMGDGVGERTLYSRSFALSAQSRSPEAAADWLTYVTSEKAQHDWLENTGRLPGAEEPYRSGLPGGGSLPFNTVSLLADGDTLEGEPEAEWNEITSAAGLLLAGKVDSAGYIAAILSSTGAEEDKP
ncbi:extracellular solute-binding protein [Paenibacillus rhizophilus]|uniref:Extracellular solute-binding protein n=1 Tax=Paenibacillus rhizophilus TaxID=1850366 RepID=A0A3N9P5Z5_9BACL|nr:extracellular solute-binding protein [Paenibacillus rhizophilus]RQW11641.1 extracellular solute-binding protein [Paenibacillus rhizophilus]